MLTYGDELEISVRLIVGLGSLVLIGVVLLDAFEAVLLPRRVGHGYRFVRLFYRNAWWAWRRIGSSLGNQETILSVFGPLALLVLFVTWACALVIGFGLLHWALATPIKGTDFSPDAATYLYFSGTTFFTLGYGDLTPTDILGRFLAVTECGLGFGFLAMIVGYHPVLTQAFSRREIVISLMDARGGSPPTGTQFLIRCRGSQAMNANLIAWEMWCAELLESSLSFPMLAYYRSQHQNQSWLAALTAVLDACALEICGTSQSDPYQARLTFAIARHAAVDLTLVFKITALAPVENRLTPSSLSDLRAALSAAGIPLPDGQKTENNLKELREMYEPFVYALSQYFLMRIPEFFATSSTADNWQTSAWMPRTPGILDLPNERPGDHFQ